MSDAEHALWDAWQRATQQVIGAVGRDISDGGGLSGTDFGVLSRLVDLGSGELRHHDLASSMGWDKSRLSHHVSRMAARRLVARRAAGKTAVLVTITAVGRKALAVARPLHAAAVRRRLVDRLGSADRAALLRLLDRLGDG